MRVLWTGFPLIFVSQKPSFLQKFSKRWQRRQNSTFWRVVGCDVMLYVGEHSNTPTVLTYWREWIFLSSGKLRYVFSLVQNSTSFWCKFPASSMQILLWTTFPSCQLWSNLGTPSTKSANSTVNTKLSIFGAAWGQFGARFIKWNLHSFVTLYRHSLRIKYWAMPACIPQQHTATNQPQHHNA